MKHSVRLIIILLCMMLAVPVVAETAEAADPAAEAVSSVPQYLDPAYFVPHFNTTMTMLAEEFREQLGEDGVNVLSTYYVLTEKDRQLMDTEPVGTVFYYSNPDLTLEAIFSYVGEVDSDEGPALSLNLGIKSEVPEVAAYLSEMILKAMLVFEYGDPETEQAIVNWFDTVEGSGDILTLPDGYTLSKLEFEGQITYAVLPPAAQNPFGQEE